ASRQVNGARGGGEHAREEVQGRGLPGAVGADDREYLARLDAEREGRDGGQAAEVLGEVPSLEDRAHAPVSSPPAAGDALASEGGPGPRFMRRVSPRNRPINPRGMKSMASTSTRP